MKQPIEAPTYERRAQVADKPGAADLGIPVASQNGPRAAPNHPTARLLRQSAVRRVQRSSGNAVAQRNIAALIAPVAAETMGQRQAAVEQEAAPDAAPSTADDAFVNATVESFQDGELRKQIGAKIEDRRDFLEGM